MMNFESGSSTEDSIRVFKAGMGTCENTDYQIGWKGVAPVLRVDELKDEEGLVVSGEGSTGSSQYGTDDEALSGEASDHDPVDGKEQLQPSAIVDDAKSKEFEIPSDELKARIIAQVEFYFSNANILTDAFMLKHVRRNKQGYVSLKLITSFRKVKALAKDFQTVAYCLRASEKLQVNDEGTKVRRIDPLPNYDETTPSRTVVAVNLPFSTPPTIENVCELFSRHGEVVLVRILRPGKQLPPDVKRHMQKHPELGQTVCAVVEYETYDAAHAACELMTDKTNWRGGMRVMVLQQQKTGSVQNNSHENVGKKRGTGTKNGEVNGKEIYCSDDPGGQTKKNLTGSKRDHPDSCQDNVDNRGDVDEKVTKEATNKERTNIPTDGDDVTIPVTGSTQEQPQQRLGKSSMRSSLSPHQDPNRLSPCSSPRASPRSSPKTSPRGSPNLRRRSVPAQSPLSITDNAGIAGGCSPAGGSPSQSPWVQRRLKAQLEDSPLSAGNSPGASPRLGRKDGGNGSGVLDGLKSSRFVIRQPRGPDGTRGFEEPRGSVTSNVQALRIVDEIC